MKRFFKRSSPKNVQVIDTELLHLHSLTITHESLPTQGLSSQQLQEAGCNSSMSDSIPPLPPPMPTLKQLRQSSYPENQLSPKPDFSSDHLAAKRKRHFPHDSQTIVRCGILICTIISTYTRNLSILLTPRRRRSLGFQGLS